jgi:hypothetical protein
MQAFLQNCPRDYNDDFKLNTDQLARKLMNQQVKTVASSRECVDGHSKLRAKQQTNNRANHDGIHEHAQNKTSANL